MLLLDQCPGVWLGQMDRGGDPQNELCVDPQTDLWGAVATLTMFSSVSKGEGMSPRNVALAIGM